MDPFPESLKDEIILLSKKNCFDLNTNPGFKSDSNFVCVKHREPVFNLNTKICV
jgi:hypothetical protein